MCTSPGHSTLAGCFKLLQREQSHPSGTDTCDISTTSFLDAFNTIMLVLYKNSSDLLHLFLHPILYGHDRSVQSEHVLRGTKVYCNGFHQFNIYLLFIIFNQTCICTVYSFIISCISVLLGEKRLSLKSPGLH